ncbi:MAG: SEC-C metal-binding domain-containing protein, partial [Candidatus Omnitrophica bacterium]|nr:SEC-C metal-binding domain-containing protein [Candidatus Omnitrophota bacterium]
MNKQREIIYSQRRQILEGFSLKERILEITAGIVDNIMSVNFPESSSVEPNIEGMNIAVMAKFGLDLGVDKINSYSNIREELFKEITGIYENKEKIIGADLMRHLERMVFLQIIDAKWKDHLYAMDSLREGIGLRAYGQRDPLVEYKREAFGMFSQMVASIEEESIEAIFKLEAAGPERFRGVFSSVQQELSHPEVSKIQRPMPAEEEAPFSSKEAEPVKTVRLSGPKVGRNDPCPCGSGKKYKKCHGS